MMTATRTDESPLAARVRAARRLPSPAICRAIRDASDVSQRQLAEALKVHRVSVARWEGGERRPRGELRLAYVALLDELREAMAGDPTNDGRPAAKTSLPSNQSAGTGRDAQQAA